MKTRLGMLLLLGASMLLAACAGSNPLLDTPMVISEVSGFWGGIWHGLVLPVSFFGSLLTDSISIYDVENTGGGYDFGFVLGLLFQGFFWKAVGKALS